MREFPVSVVASGAGSQPEAEGMEYLPLPHEMTTFALPACDLEADPATLAATCAVLDRLRAAMEHTPADAPGGISIELTGQPPAVIELLNQSLGHGEVSVRLTAPVPLEIQETVFAGVWRVQQVTADGVMLRDTLYAGALPPEVVEAARAGTGEISVPPLRPDMMNAPAVLNELRERSHNYQPGRPVHVINLSLLPMTPADLEYLFDACGTGAVSLLSRGYGNCRVTSTRLPHVWWVQYFNSMDQIILNTIEVTEVPEVALAAAEDYADSAVRLAEWLAVMRDQ